MKFHFCFRNWSKWETTEKGEIMSVNTVTGQQLPGKCATYEIQQRTCDVCGKKQLREERSSL